VSNAGHTPGPWKAEGFEQIVGEGNFYGGLIMGADDCTIVAQCVMPHNMPLLQAAPELLEAVRLQHRVIDLLLARVIELDQTFMPTRSKVWPLIKQANAVQLIAKATGASS
jgi:dihydrodipicolinate synthase/N-acetylneuraminate lyase